MLQPRENKIYGNKCTKLIILLVLFVAGFFVFFTWFLIFIYFSLEKSSRGIKRNLTISEIIEISGITECLNNSGIGKNNGTKTKITYKNDKYKQKTVNKKKVKNKSENNFYSLNKATTSDQFKKQSKNLQNTKTQSVLEKHGSIWDDYESVIDIMSKSRKK